MPTVTDKISAAPLVKPAFNAEKFLLENLEAIRGTKIIIRHITGTAYRVNWYNPDTNKIVRTKWMRVIEENGAAEIHHSEKQ